MIINMVLFLVFILLQQALYYSKFYINLQHFIGHTTLVLLFFYYINQTVFLFFRELLYHIKYYMYSIPHTILTNFYILVLITEYQIICTLNFTLIDSSITFYFSYTRRVVYIRYNLKYQNMTRKTANTVLFSMFPVRQGSILVVYIYKYVSTIIEGYYVLLFSCTNALLLYSTQYSGLKLLSINIYFTGISLFYIDINSYWSVTNP